MDNKVDASEGKFELEIDYDKLAEAIVKAKNESKMMRNSTKFRTLLMKTFNGIVYIMISLYSIMGIGWIWTDYYPRTSSIMTCIAFSIGLAVIAIFTFLCQQETLDDKQVEAFNYFSTNISLVALIIALVSLIKK